MTEETITDSPKINKAVNAAQGVGKGTKATGRLTWQGIKSRPGIAALPFAIYHSLKGELEEELPGAGAALDAVLTTPWELLPIF